jgi:hypothetical protein
MLLTDLGLEALLDEDSFNEGADIAYHPIGLVIPELYDDEETPSYRDVLNRINKSVFGSVVQTQAFQLSYLVIQPRKPADTLKLDESDILDITATSVADKIVKTAKVIYRPKEYNYLSGDESWSTEQHTSDVAANIIKTDKERTIETVLCDEFDAGLMASRWGFILENGTTSLKVKTKLQAISLEVGSVVDITHRKIYERLGTSSHRKIALVESVKKTGTGVEIELVDLSNAFNRVGCINELTTTWANTNEDGRIYGGFVTDAYGLIDNDSDSFGSNLIW